jgi:hypothetical protein
LARADLDGVGGLAGTGRRGEATLDDDDVGDGGVRAVVVQELLKHRAPAMRAPNRLSCV